MKAFKWGILTPLLLKEGLGVVENNSLKIIALGVRLRQTTPNPSLKRGEKNTPLKDFHVSSTTFSVLVCIIFAKIFHPTPTASERRTG